MRGFQLTIFVMAIVLLSMQSVHFVYYKFIYSHESVLDDSLDKQIKASQSIDELLQEYKKAQTKVKDYEIKNPDKEFEYYKRQKTEPYKSKIKFENAIKDWEKKQRDYARLWYQWFAGVLLFSLGGAMYWIKRSWLGLSVLTAGLGEMIWWSSPNLTRIGSLLEYEKLLNTKLLLTLLTFILLSAAWLVSEARRKKNKPIDS